MSFSIQQPCQPMTNRRDSSSRSESASRDSIIGSVNKVFCAAQQALDNDLSVIRSMSERTLSPNAGGTDVDGTETSAEEDCDGIASEIQQLHTFGDSLRDELSKIEDSWRQSSSRSLTVTADHADDDNEKDDASNSTEATAPTEHDDSGSSNIRVLSPVSVDRENVEPNPSNHGESIKSVASWAATVETDSEALSNIKSPMQLQPLPTTNNPLHHAERHETDAKSSNTSGTTTPASTSSSSMAFLDVTTAANCSVNDERQPATLPVPESSEPCRRDLLLSSALYQTGYGGMSLALASDILASQIYAQQSLLPCWLNRQLAAHPSKSICGVAASQNNNQTHWLFGVPIVGSAAKDGQM